MLVSMSLNEYFYFLSISHLRLLKGKLRNVSNILNESKHSDLSKWIKSTKSNKNNGFTRLNQDSDHENEPLENDSDSDEITVPLSKA